MTDKEDGLVVKQVYYDADEILFTEGDAPAGLFIIEEGEVEVFRETDGRRSVIAKLGRGEVVGELSMVEDIPRTRSARALTPVHALIVEPDQLEDALGQTPPLVRMVLRRVVRKLHRTNDLAFGPNRPRDSAVP